MPPDSRGPATWQEVREAVMARIRARDYAPGALIPNEADLAAEFGVARATVNRALRGLAEDGFLERRRKAGTRVATAPVRKAVLSIPVLRLEVEASGAAYAYRLLTREQAPPPPEVAEAMGVAAERVLLHLISLHGAGDRPVVLEDRWVDPATVPDLLAADLESQSPNEWLVANAPYTHGTMTFSAEPAGADQARALGCAAGDSLLVLTRATWMDAAPITHVRQWFPPGHRMLLQL